MDAEDPVAAEPQAETADPFAVAARRLKEQSPADADADADADAHADADADADADAAPASGSDPLDAALSSLDEAEIEIRRARDGLAVALGAARHR